MAQHSIKLPSVQSSRRELGERQLGVDKAGVIVGFLVGLPLGLGVVGEQLSLAGAPEWAVVGGLVLTVLATTLTGMRAGDWLARHLNQS